MSKEQKQSITERRLTRKRKKRRNQLIRKIVLYTLVAIAIIITISLMARGCAKKDTLAGIWDYDDVTAYQFDGKGEGALLLPDSTYIFEYEINENKVHIDFEDENALDYTYQFAVAGETLILSGGEGEEKFDYELRRRREQ